MMPTNEASPEQVGHLVFANVCTMDRRYEAIMQVIHGSSSPKTDLAKREQPEQKLKAPNPKPRFEMNWPVVVKECIQ